MRRERQRFTEKDMKLLEHYSMGNKEAFEELKRLYQNCPPEGRAEAMKEITRHFRATAVMVNHAKYTQGKKN